MKPIAPYINFPLPEVPKQVEIEESESSEEIKTFQPKVIEKQIKNVT